MTYALDPRTVARALGGEARGNRVLAPGPGHSAQDRSLSIETGPDLPDGFVVHSFAGDDPIACRDYVREKACLPRFEPKKQNGHAAFSGGASAKPDPWKIILPVPDDVDPPDDAFLARFAPAGYAFTETRQYVDTEERLAFIVARYDPRPNGETADKTFRPFTYCQAPNGKREWRAKAIEVRRLIYRLDRLAFRVDEPVLVVEGERSADGAQRRFPDYVCITSSGGSKAAAKTDWTPLAGRKVTIWPDHDDAGLAYAADVAAEARAAGAASVHIVAVPATFPPKWDLANALPEGVTEADLRKLLDGAATPKTETAEPVEIDDLVTEDSAALTFAALFADKLRYCHDTGAWFEWAKTHWRRDRTALAFAWAREVARDLACELAPSSRKVVGKTAFAGGVEKFARSDRRLAVTAENWDKNAFLLGTPSGTVDLRTGKLRPSVPAEGITKITAVAPAAQADCPLWRKFLDETMASDQELIRFVQQFCGYALTGDTREHALVFGYGDGGNGKSVFVSTITGILGDYSTESPMDTFTASQNDRHPTDLAMLRGARLVTASETEEGRAWAETRIKQLTGGDRITARFMRQDFFTFQPEFKLFIIGNHKPRLNSVDDAARRRFNIVPFTNKPAKKDEQLVEKLKAEWPGILRWMIEGCLDWQANGLCRPDRVKAATAEYFEAQDSIGLWLDEACDAEPGNPHKWETAGKLFESWTSYALAAGEKPGSAKGFADLLEKRGFVRDRKRVHGKVARLFVGIQLINEHGA